LNKKSKKMLNDRSLTKKKRNWPKIFLYGILVLYAFITLYPFLWAVSASFKSLAEITNSSFSIIPKNPTLNNYIHLFSSSSYFLRWTLNSIMIAVFGTVVNVILNSMAGYSLSRLSFPGRNAIFYALIAAMTIPGQVLLIPNFLILKSMGLLNSYSAIVLPAAVNITYIFLMKQYFTNFSKEVEEAAKLDGLSGTQTFFYISLPMAKPMIATQATFIFLGFWNDFVKPMLYLKDVNKFTLPLGIQYTQSKYSGFTQWDQVMTASVVSLIPILLMYIVLNKYFMQGVRLDGEK